MTTAMSRRLLALEARLAGKPLPPGFPYSPLPGGVTEQVRNELIHAWNNGLEIKELSDAALSVIIASKSGWPEVRELTDKELTNLIEQE